MRCLQCYSNDCIHCQVSLQNMAAQQQMGMANMASANNLAYLNGMLGRAVSEEMVKAYSTPKKNKKLLLIRK